MTTYAFKLPSRMTGFASIGLSSEANPSKFLRTRWAGRSVWPSFYFYPLLPATSGLTAVAGQAERRGQPLPRGRNDDAILPIAFHHR